MRRLAVAGVVLQVSTPALAHDWYEGLHNADGDSCCGGKDCQPVDFCLLPGGAQGLDIPAIGCVGIDWSKVLQVGSPDGRAHVCMGVDLSSPGHGRHDEPAQRFQRCVILPGEV